VGWYDEHKEAPPLPQDYDDPSQAPPGYHWERIGGGHVLLPGDRTSAPAPAPAPPRSPPTPNPTTPGISTPDVSNATYGKKIPISALGLARIGGSIIFGPYIEDGLASFGVSFGFPADPTGTRELREIAFDSKVGWTSADGFTGEPFTYRFYPGTQAQDADPLEIANFPDEPVAYRPQILLFFENLSLESFQEKIPYVAAVIADTTDGDDPADGINLGTALERIARSPWTTYTPETFEAVNVIDIVGGILLADDYSFLQLLQYISRIYRNLDIVQTDKLRIKDHGAHVTPDIRLDLSRIVSSDSPVQFQRQEAAATPRELELVTIDPDADYCWVSSKAQRPRDPVVTSASVGKETVTLPLIMNAATRTSMVYFAQYAEEAARKKVSFGALAYGYQIEPGDRVALIDIGDGIENEVFKITKTMHGANCVVQCEAETIMRCNLAFDDSDSGGGDDLAVEFLDGAT
jgi:putative tail protein